MILIFLGPPGSGKGTQARKFANQENFKIFGLGEFFRKEIKENTEIGRKLADTINKGQLADISLIMSILEKQLDAGNWILDGFPRSLEQAKHFEAYANLHNLSDIFVVDFILNDEIVKNRLSHRKICEICGAPAEDIHEVCCFCSARKFYKRDDDNASTIGDRLEVFSSDHEKLINFYQNKSQYHKINASYDVAKVYESIRSCVFA